MPDLSFAQPERRNFLVPILIAAAIVAAGLGLYYGATPHSTAELSIPHTATLATHTEYATNTRLVGVRDPAEDIFYVVTTVHIRNRLKLPLFIKDITGTLTAPDGTVRTVSAVESSELPNLYVAFPKLKPLASPPLLRESTIAPHADAEGMVILALPATQEDWDKRKSATVTVDFYHQGSFNVDIPK